MRRSDEYDCKYTIQLSHSGRQRDVPGVENFMQKGLSSTSNKDTFHGLLCEAATVEQIHELVRLFASGARRARAAGLDGIELHASHGYLFTRFLSSAINDRKDEYGGSLETGARFLLEVIRAIRKEIGNDFHLQVKTNAVDEGSALFPWEKKGNLLDESIQICKWIEEAGADAIHVSMGSIFPHPLMPPGGFPIDEASWWYGNMASSGVRGYMNYTLFHFKVLRPIFLYLWNRTERPLGGRSVCRRIARRGAQVGTPVINTGGYQRGSLIRKVISEGSCDGVAIRPFTDRQQRFAENY